MNTTSESLLLRLNTLAHDSIDQSAWQEFVKIYTPLIFSWARQSSGVSVIRPKAGDIGYSLISRPLKQAF